MGEALSLPRQTEAFLAASVADYLREGIERGDAAIVVATEPHREALLAAIRERRVDVDAGLLTSRLLMLDARETLDAFIGGGGPDAARFSRTVTSAMDRVGAGRPLRAYGEMVAVLWADGDVASAIALEDLWNDLAAEREFALLCAYPMSAFADPADAAAFVRVCEQHSGVIPSEGYTELPPDHDQQRRRAWLGCNGRCARYGRRCIASRRRRARRSFTTPTASRCRFRHR